MQPERQLNPPEPTCSPETQARFESLREQALHRLADQHVETLRCVRADYEAQKREIEQAYADGDEYALMDLAKGSVNGVDLDTLDRLAEFSASAP